jgi:hypothetical protein
MPTPTPNIVITGNRVKRTCTLIVTAGHEYSEFCYLHGRGDLLYRDGQPRPSLTLAPLLHVHQQHRAKANVGDYQVARGRSDCLGSTGNGARGCRIEVPGPSRVSLVALELSSTSFPTPCACEISTILTMCLRTAAAKPQGNHRAAPEGACILHVRLPARHYYRSESTLIVLMRC